MPATSEPSPSTVEFEILLSLAAGQLHGYGIMQQVESRTGGTTRLGPGTLYGAIKRMTRAGGRAAAAAARQMADTVNIAVERGLIAKTAAH